MEKHKKYKAFISYSHKDCGVIAPIIQEGLENIGKPLYKFRRELEVFRDETNLSASPTLWPNIEIAIKSSEHFILLASPSGANSYWIDKEISVWKQKFTADQQIKNFYVALIDGELEWDRSKNDFNWEKTNSIPKSLSLCFESEPFWIDLREYKNKEIKYNEISFGSKIAKILGSLISKEPREIFSAELKRKNVIRNVLVSTILLLLALVITSISYFRLERFAQNTAKSNRLIAAGNAISQNDYSKTLLFYTYGYLLNPDSNNFKMITAYYDDNTLLLNNEGDSDLISKFYSQIKLKEHVSIYNSTRLNTYLSVPENSYYFTYGDTVEVVNYQSGKREVIKLNEECISGCLSNPLSSKIYFYKENQCTSVDTMIVCYDLKTRKKSPILFRQALSNNKFLIKGVKSTKQRIIYTHSADECESKITPFISEDSRHLIIMAGISSSYQIFIVGLKDDTITEHRFNFEKLGLGSEYNQVPELALLMDGKILYCKAKSSLPPGHSTIDFFYGLQSNKTLYKLYEGSQIGSSASREPNTNGWGFRDSIFFTDGIPEGYFVCGTVGGELLAYRIPKDWDSSYLAEPDIVSGPKTMITTITSTVVNYSYIVCGTKEGVIHFWANELKGLQNEGGWNLSDHSNFAYDNLASIKLPSQSPIIKLAYNIENDFLFAVNELGEIYQINLKQYLKLSPDSKVLKHQIKNLKINDLTEDEKEKYGIEKLNL